MSSSFYPVEPGDLVLHLLAGQPGSLHIVISSTPPLLLKLKYSAHQRAGTYTVFGRTLHYTPGTAADPDPYRFFNGGDTPVPAPPPAAGELVRNPPGHLVRAHCLNECLLCFGAAVLAGSGAALFPELRVGGRVPGVCPGCYGYVYALQDRRELDELAKIDAARCTLQGVDAEARARLGGVYDDFLGARDARVNRQRELLDRERLVAITRWARENRQVLFNPEPSVDSTLVAGLENIRLE